MMRGMKSRPFDLSGMVALVTGASRGLGQYFGRALARAGADLVITSRHRDALEPFRREIEALGRKVVRLLEGSTSSSTTPGATCESAPST